MKERANSLLLSVDIRPPILWMEAFEYPVLRPLEETRVDSFNGMMTKAGSALVIEPEHIERAPPTPFGDYSVIFSEIIPDPESVPPGSIIERPTYLPKVDESATATINGEVYSLQPASTQFRLQRYSSMRTGAYWSIDLDIHGYKLIGKDGNMLLQATRLDSATRIVEIIEYNRSLIGNHSFRHGVKPPLYICYGHHGLEFMYATQDSDDWFANLVPTEILLIANHLKDNHPVSGPYVFDSAYKTVSQSLRYIQDKLEKLEQARASSEIQDTREIEQSLQLNLDVFATAVLPNLNSALAACEFESIKGYENVQDITAEMWEKIEEYEAREQSKRILSRLFFQFGYLAHGSVEADSGWEKYQKQGNNPLWLDWVYKIAQKMQKSYATEPKGNLNQIFAALNSGLLEHIDTLDTGESSEHFLLALKTEITRIIKTMEFAPNDVLFVD